ncbi:hypothetical protein [Chromobacterium sp. Beijing]|nr:hypothetical protein [Chromobacterium sp. Beijing]UJB31824.1 hypothetical protein HQN78_12575 [Chromobacterium sp. Beijing]
MTMYRQQLRRLKRQPLSDRQSKRNWRRIMGILIFIAGCAILLGGLS